MAINHEDFASQFAVQHGIDVTADLSAHPEWTPQVTTEDFFGAGVAYTYLEVSYLEGDDIRATRNIAKILPGNRTEIAYWTEAAPTKTLTIHQGKGKLIIGDPTDGSVESIRVNGKHLKEVTLPSGRFYTIQADPNSTEPFVVSGFYEPPPDWGNLEIPLEPGNDHVDTIEGIKRIPSDFRALL